MDDTQKVRIKLSGDEFNKEAGYNLYYLAESLSSIQTLIDKSYLTIVNKPTMSNDDRQNLMVKVINIEEGSFIGDIAIQLKDIILPLTPLLVESGPELIWGLVKQSYEYLKAIISSRKKGDVPTVRMDNSTNSLQLINNSGTVLINNLAPEAIPLAEKVSPTFYKLSNLITEDGRVESILIGDKEKPLDQITISHEEKGLFKKSTYLEDKYHTINGIIKVANANNFNGKIEIRDTEGIADGEYKIDFVSKQIGEKILSGSFLKYKTYNCYRRIEFDPTTLNDEVIGLRIIEEV